MSGPLVTICTPTFNRPEMFAECVAAVLAQTFTDWTWWVVFNCYEFPGDYINELEKTGLLEKFMLDQRILIVWYPTVDELRAENHIPAQIVNWLYPKVTTPYIYFLADDDLIDPDGLGVLISKMKYRGFATDDGSCLTRDAVYGRCEVVDQRSDGSFTHACWCYEHGDVGLGTGINPHCLLDGGQVLHTADLWSRATADGWQLTDSKADAPANDGTLLARLAQFARFYYVPQRIVTHRRHKGATHHRPQVST